MSTWMWMLTQSTKSRIVSIEIIISLGKNDSTMNSTSWHQVSISNIYMYTYINVNWYHFISELTDIEKIPSQSWFSWRLSNPPFKPASHDWGTDLKCGILVGRCFTVGWCGCGCLPRLISWRLYVCFFQMEVFFLEVLLGFFCYMETNNKR